MTDSLSRIAFIARSESRLFHLALARRLKEESGSTLHLYCSTANEVRYYAEKGGDSLFASITDAGILMKSCAATGVDPDAVIARARAFEARTGLTVNELAVANRHLGRGYSPGGFYHARSRQSENTSYVQMIHAYNEVLAFWEGEFRSRRITMVLNGGKEAAVMARALGLPFRGLAGSRFRNLHYWAWNEYQENPSIEQAFAANGPLPAADLDAPYFTHRTNRARAMKSFGLGETLRRLGIRALRYVYWRIRGYEAARNYFIGSVLRMNWRRWTEYRRHNRLATTRLTDLHERPFVYFPLHVEPEAALQVLSPEFFHQHAAIVALARDLPAGTILAVKEHFAAVGRRPDNFYQQICDLKNVVLLDMWELGFEVIRRAAVVTTICGSAGFEGAIMGKPVIALGQHNTYNFLPHVRVVQRLSDLKIYLAEALSEAHDADSARALGQRFLSAVVSVSFDMREYDYVNLENFSAESVKEAYNALRQSLSDPAIGETGATGKSSRPAPDSPVAGADIARLG